MTPTAAVKLRKQGLSYSWIARSSGLSAGEVRHMVNAARERQRAYHRDWWHRHGNYQRKLHSVGLA